MYSVNTEAKTSPIFVNRIVKTIDIGMKAGCSYTGLEINTRTLAAVKKYLDEEELHNLELVFTHSLLEDASSYYQASIQMFGELGIDESDVPQIIDRTMFKLKS